jgi:hypothetical protein
LLGAKRLGDLDVITIIIFVFLLPHQIKFRCTVPLVAVVLQLICSGLYTTTYTSFTAHFLYYLVLFALFTWLISHQLAVLLSQNKPATSNQPAVLFSQTKPAPAISHQPHNGHIMNAPVFIQSHSYCFIYLKNIAKPSNLSGSTSVHQSELIHEFNSGNIGNNAQHTA